MEQGKGGGEGEGKGRGGEGVMATYKGRCKGKGG